MLIHRDASGVARQLASVPVLGDHGDFAVSHVANGTGLPVNEPPNWPSAKTNW
jgi:hypothetical protein